MKLLVDTGVFSAALSRKRRPEFEPLVAHLPGNQLNLAAQFGAGRKLRYIGNERNRAWLKMTTAVYNLIRITTLDAAIP